MRPTLCWPLTSLLLLLSDGAAADPTPEPAVESTSAQAADPTAVDERLARVQERRANLAREVERLRGQERGLLEQLERLELEVRLRTEELREVRLVLTRTNAQLDRTARRLRELELSLERARPLVAARARALYKLGRLSYLRLLLSIERPGAVLQGYRYVTTLARRDNERIAAFRRDLTSLAATREELSAQTRATQALRVELDRKRRGLDAERGRQEAFLTELVARKEKQAAFLAEMEQAETRLRRLLSGLAQGEVEIPFVALKGALPWPVQGPVRVPFGRRRHPRFDTYTLQNGIEIEAPLEGPVRAVHEGTVVFADRFLGYGLLVIVDHGAQHLSLYGRLAEAGVPVGRKVNGGDTVGLVGPSHEGAGLYFEIRSQGKPDDPLEWLRKAPPSTSH